MDGLMLVGWRPPPRRTEHRDDYLTVYARGCAAIDMALLESRSQFTTAVVNPTNDVSLDDALLEVRRRRNDDWLEQRKTVMTEGLSYSNPVGSRILSVR